MSCCFLQPLFFFWDEWDDKLSQEAQRGEQEYQPKLLLYFTFMITIIGMGMDVRSLDVIGSRRKEDFSKKKT